MSNVIKRTDALDYRTSVNTPEFPTVDWIINPDLSLLGSVHQKYWKIVLDTVVEMTAPEKAVVDQAELDANSIENPIDIRDDFSGTEIDASKWVKTINIGNPPVIETGDIANGVCLLEAGNTLGASSAIGTGLARPLQQKGLSVDLRFRCVDTGNLSHEFAFTEGTTNEYIGILISGTNWIARTTTGGVSTDTTLKAVDALWHRVRIDAVNGFILFRFDTDISETHTTNIPAGAFDFNITSKKTAIGIKQLYVDDVRLQATRVLTDTVA